MKTIQRKGFFGFLFLTVITNTGCSLLGIRTAEEVPFVIKEKNGDKEIRHYPPRIVAQITLQGEYSRVQGEAFRILAGYIFGKNRVEQKIAMTAPVTQKPLTSEGNSTKIAMTAPVNQFRTTNGWTMTFSMPLKYKKISELPKPIDERIQILEQSGGTFAVIRFTWATSEERNQKKATELLQWLESEGKFKALSGPHYAGYDPPWTIPFFRRQEMIVEVGPAK